MIELSDKQIRNLSNTVSCSKLKWSPSYQKCNLNRKKHQLSLPNGDTTFFHWNNLFNWYEKSRKIHTKFPLIV